MTQNKIFINLHAACSGDLPSRGVPEEPVQAGTEKCTSGGSQNYPVAIRSRENLMKIDYH